MDNLGAYTGTISLAIIVLKELYKMFNHKRLKSSCCDKTFTTSIDIESTTPPHSPVAPLPSKGKAGSVEPVGDNNV